jgi:putative spermidine/putrescine transport system substrate-binding protein
MASKTIGGNESSLSRRGLLKGAALGAGAAIGSGVVTGFPTIWAQEIKDITLVHIGGSYACIKEIADQAGKDLGFKIQMQVVDPPTQLNRALT